MMSGVARAMTVGLRAFCCATRTPHRWWGYREGTLFRLWRVRSSTSTTLALVACGRRLLWDRYERGWRLCGCGNRYRDDDRLRGEDLSRSLRCRSYNRGHFLPVTLIRSCDCYHTTVNIPCHIMTLNQAEGDTYIPTASDRPPCGSSA